MNDAFMQLPCSSNEIISISACPMPSASPPWIWPSTTSGLIRTPQSSTAMKRRQCTWPVPGSMSTTEMYAP